MIIKKIILPVILLFFLFLYLHNAWFFSPNSGYDAGIHSIYTDIIIHQKRIPLPKDTPESYNPPLFYYLSGKLAQFSQPFFQNDFFKAFKSWQLTIAFLLPLAGFLWFDTFKRLNPQTKWFSFFFLIWLLSIPVLNKMAPMYNLEILQMIEASFVIWFFIKYFLKTPKINYAIFLGIFCGIMLSTRIMSALLLVSIGLTVFLLWWHKKINFKKMIILNLVFTVITLSIGGWYYYFYKDFGVFDSGENINDFKGIPLLQRQPKSFYTNTFFRTMMKTPIRPNFINSFTPIFYSTFWGDYWNYYRHRRYPLTPEQEKQFTSNKYKISPERLKVLAWQNRINLIPTLILITAFFLSLKKTIWCIIKRKKISYHQFSENFLTIFFSIAFTGFFYTNLKFPNLYKGDTIKASFILFAIPVLIYFATKLIQKAQKINLLFYFLLLSILISIGFNIHFSYY